jgi:hypothetical protein
MPDASTLFAQLCHDLLDDPTIRSAKIFGKPNLTVNGNTFLAFDQDALAAKLDGPAHAEALALDGAEPWDPSGKGRPMRAWVRIPADHAERWPDIAEAARAYVATLPPK